MFFCFHIMRYLRILKYGVHNTMVLITNMFECLHIKYLHHIISLCDVYELNFTHDIASKVKGTLCAIKPGLHCIV